MSCGEEGDMDEVPTDRKGLGRGHRDAEKKYIVEINMHK